MAPPSAALEHGTFDIGDGVEPFTSAAGETNIPESLALICFAAFVVYNIASLFGIDVSAIINFSTTVYRAILGWTGIIHQKSVRINSLAIATFSGNWIKDTYRLNKYAYAFRAGLEHMISTPSEHLGRTVLVNTVIVSGAGILALIRGLPSDVSAPELRRYLESVLFIQYHQGVDRAVNQLKSVNAPIETSRCGLWDGTCV